ncbi:MAG: RNA polymerase sigma factor [Ignavibacteriae bacterium]|nr:RNA polymerase sigma factor [Ignavibacteriota bacterium]NOG97896.1 RNA polymerase sigma factor [Ignavibacteriota bacterium]
MEVSKNINPKTSKMPDSVVIKRVLGGEKELFEILLRRYNQTLFRALRSYIKRDTDVEDIMQDTYLKCYEKLNTFKGKSAFSTWLIRIGINEALQRIRKTKKIPQIDNNEAEEELVNLLPSEDQVFINPDNDINNSEMRMHIEKAIDKLPEKYRVVFILREVEGLSNSEVADCLDITGNNVKIRLHRAKNLLKETLYKMTPREKILEFGNSRCDKVVDYVMKRIK